MSRRVTFRRVQAQTPHAIKQVHGAKNTLLTLVFSKPLEELGGVPPNYRELLNWDAVDNTLQLLRFIPLLVYACHDVRRPRTIIQSIANPSAFVVTRTVERRFRIVIYKGLLLVSETIANVRRLALLVYWARVLVERALSHMSGQVYDPPSTTERLVTISEVVASVGEAFDVLAFITGNSLFWRTLGWTRGGSKELLHRRRIGLERVGVWVSLVAIIMQYYVARRRSAEDKESLESTSGRPSESILLRRRLHWLAVERLCLVADGSFTLLEALMPQSDKEGVEASTGAFAATLRLRRIWNEACYGALEL
ncbi:hypothetical protein MCUN1_002018 [Malassezia cuniculi]|uniref:Uncharacterized protein n=1 Tax=Malassezia cuniculi TaxID=948313 RepID=A0AAF0EYY0_9BASI|nr:hypothetical protein MCUN1_002018 [Malassezia cuniculi]